MPAILDIYNWYILHTEITFETEPVSTDDMEMRMKEKLNKYDWIVGEVDGEIIGYAYYGSFRPRTAYNHTVESTIYLSMNHTGKGLGRLLLDELIRSARQKGFREMLGVIALPNPASVRLHKNAGFFDAGTLKNVGYKFGRYIDVMILQKTIV